VQADLGETAEWFGLLDPYFLGMIITGSGVIINYDGTFPPNLFEASAVLAEWYKTFGPLLVQATPSDPVAIDWEVAQQAIAGNAVLNSFQSLWTYVPALNVDGDTDVFALEQTF
jgi:hypothetical protein